MKKFLFTPLFLMVMIFVTMPQANAYESCGIPGGYDAHCGIWICLPGKFPASCESQKATFKARVKKSIRGSCTPLPSMGSCSPDGNAKDPYKVKAGIGRCSRNRDGWNDPSCTRSGSYIWHTIDGVAQPRYWF